MGHVEDAHGLAHVQHVDLAALGDAGGLQDQAAGLGDGHEEPGGARVGDGDRAARARSARGRGAARCRSSPARCRIAPPRSACADDRGQRLHVGLGGALGGAHHARGRHRLVGRDQGEVGHAPLAGRDRPAARWPRSSVARASSGCSSHMGTCLSAAACRITSGRSRVEQLGHPRQVAYRGEHRHRPRAEGRPRLAVDVVERRLGAVEQQQPLEAARRRRWASWRASSLPMLPPAPVTSTVLPSKKRVSSAAARSTRVAAEERLLGHGHGLDERRLAAQQRLQRRDHAQVAHAARQLGDAPQHARRGRGNGHDDLVDRPPPRDLGQIVPVVPRIGRPSSVASCFSGSSSTKPITSTSRRRVIRSLARRRPRGPRPR